MLIAGARGYGISFYGGALVSEAIQVSVAVGEDHKGLNIALKPGPPVTPLTGPKGTGPGSGSSGAGSPLGSSTPGTLTTAPISGVGLANSLVDQKRRKHVVVRLRCKSVSDCRGKLALIVMRRVRRARKWVREMITIGSARFVGRPGATFSVTVSIGARGRTLLRSAHGKLAARLQIAQSMPKPAETTVKHVLLVAEPAATRRPRKRKR